MVITHTPTPWFAGEPYCDEDIGNCIAVSIGPFAAKNHYEDTIVEAWSGNHDAETNAEFIVTAVNSHDVMLEALEAIIEFDNENVLVVEGKAAKSEEDKALNKILVMVANARDKAKP